MRITFEETKELVVARLGSFVAGEISEDVLRASLKAMGLFKGEIEELCMQAAREYIAVRSKRTCPETERMKASLNYIEQYLKR